jgi:hypothetical protein
MIQCEMCEAPLYKIRVPQSNQMIKLSFRQGGQSNVLSILNQLIEQRAWEVS